MQKRVMLIVSVAGVLLLPPTYAAYAQTAPASAAGPAGTAQPGSAPAGPATGAAPVASPAPAALAPVTAADVQAFISDPAAFIKAVPGAGPELTQRIRQLLALAAQNGQLTEILAALNTVGAIPGISPQQLAAIVAGANAAAADFAAAQNLEAQRAIQVAVASNPALSGAQQALAAASQTQAPATADLGPAGGLIGGGQSSAIGGAGSTSGGSSGSSSASSSGTGTSSGSSSGISSGSGSFAGATGSGSSSNNNDDNGSGTTVDTSPISRT